MRSLLAGLLVSFGLMSSVQAQTAVLEVPFDLTGGDWINGRDSSDDPLKPCFRNNNINTIWPQQFIAIVQGIPYYMANSCRDGSGANPRVWVYTVSSEVYKANEHIIDCVARTTTRTRTSSGGTDNVSVNANIIPVNGVAQAFGSTPLSVVARAFCNKNGF